jgi:hypothetical protein
MMHPLQRSRSEAEVGRGGDSSEAKAEVGRGGVLPRGRGRARRSPSPEAEAEAEVGLGRGGDLLPRPKLRPRLGVGRGGAPCCARGHTRKRP